MIIGVLLEIGLMIVSGVITAATFLITHFDVTNSLLFSGMVQILTYKQEITSSVRWIMFFGIFFVCLVLQHAFKVGRIIFTIFSIVAFGFLAAIWKEYGSTMAQLTAVGVWMLIAGILNFVSWVTMKEQIE
jgi:hypothetical protein